MRLCRRVRAFGAVALGAQAETPRLCIWKKKTRIQIFIMIPNRHVHLPPSRHRLRSEPYITTLGGCYTSNPENWQNPTRVQHMRTRFHRRLGCS